MTTNDITVGELAAADTVLLIDKDGAWKFTSQQPATEAAAAFVRIGLAIEEEASGRTDDAH